MGLPGIRCQMMLESLKWKGVHICWREVREKEGSEEKKRLPDYGPGEGATRTGDGNFVVPRILGGILVRKLQLVLQVSWSKCGQINALSYH